MTPFLFEVATIPFALYFLALAWLHCRNHPTLITSRRDFVAASVAVSGVLFVGPLQVLPGVSAWTTWGVGVWGLLVVFYVLSVALISARLRPRFVVYNTTMETLRRAITTVAVEFDEDARWSGDAMNMPGLGVQFYLDDSPRGRVTTVVSIGRDISPSGWKRLRNALDKELEHAPRPHRRAWPAFVTAGVGLLAADVLGFAYYYSQICEALAFYMSA